MPDITPNLGLKKPLGTETVSRATYNENLEIMDANAVKKGNGIAELTGGTLADRPAAGVAGRYYFAQDTGEIYLDTGTAWVLAAAGREDITALQEGLDAHQADTMPHRFVSDGVTYRWGLTIIGGVVNMTYEEVV